MKTISRENKIVFLFLTVLILTSLNACSDFKKAFDKGRDFTKTDEVTDLDELIKECITPEMDVIEITFNKLYNDNALFSYMRGEMQIYYVNPENAKKKKMSYVDLRDNTLYESDDSQNREHFRKYKGFKVDKLGCEKIADNVNAAIKLMADDGLDCDGIGSYTIRLAENPEKITHVFSLERSVGAGQRKVLYDEYSFVADIEGNVKKL